MPAGGARTAGRGKQIGRVYRLNDGSIIYVLPSGTSTVAPPTATPTSTPMSYWSVAFDQAWQLIIDHDVTLWDAIDNTIEVAAVSTGIAAVLGCHSAAARLGRFRGRGLGLTLANAGLGLPPVVVGIVFTLLLIPAGPLGGLRWVFTLKGVMLAQTVLAFPVVVALTASAVGNITDGLLEQARAYDARLWRVWALPCARLGSASSPR